MRAIQLNFVLLALVTTTGHLSANENSKGNQIQDSNVWTSNTSKLSDRFKRQSETTTPKPKKPRPSNIFSLIQVLLTETRDDAGRAFNEIGTLFNSQFANGTTKKEPSTTTSTTPSPSPSDSDEDNEITTTTEPFRITRDEFLGILRSNVQGIVNLFGKEFKVAIKDSNDNVREFGRGLGTALRPLFNGNKGKNSTRTSGRINLSLNGSSSSSSNSSSIIDGSSSSSSNSSSSINGSSSSSSSSSSSDSV